MAWARRPEVELSIRQRAAHRRAWLWAVYGALIVFGCMTVLSIGLLFASDGSPVVPLTVLVPLGSFVSPPSSTRAGSTWSPATSGRPCSTRSGWLVRPPPRSLPAHGAYHTTVMRSAGSGAIGLPAEEPAVRYFSSVPRSSPPTRSPVPWPSVGEAVSTARQEAVGAGDAVGGGRVDGAAVEADGVGDHGPIRPAR